MPTKKHTSRVTDYLDKTGILSNGSASDIALSKKKYWKQYRREWRKEQRRQCKSCTIFFTASEHRTILQAIPETQNNLAGFVKHAALSTAQNKHTITKQIIGQVREALYISYSKVETLGAKTEIKNVLIELEQKILLLIK